MKKTQLIISIEQARTLALKAQGLLSPSVKKGKKATLTTIENLGYVQLILWQ